MMLNKMFMFHYQPNQNTGCKVKFVVNMNRQPERLLSHRHHRWSEQPFYLPRVICGLPLDYLWLPLDYPWFQKPGISVAIGSVTERACAPVYRVHQKCHRKKWYITGAIANSFTKFTVYIEKSSGHTSGKFLSNIWLNSQIPTIWTSRCIFQVNRSINCHFVAGLLTWRCSYSSSLVTMSPVTRWNFTWRAFLELWLYLNFSTLSACFSQHSSMPRMHLTAHWASSCVRPLSSSILLHISNS